MQGLFGRMNVNVSQIHNVYCNKYTICTVTNTQCVLHQIQMCTRHKHTMYFAANPQCTQEDMDCATIKCNNSQQWLLLQIDTIGLRVFCLNIYMYTYIYADSLFWTPLVSYRLEAKANLRPNFTFRNHSNLLHIPNSNTCHIRQKWVFGISIERW